MKFLLKNHLETALSSLAGNKMRTFLTVTGMTIGIASITAVLSLTAGADSFLKQQMQTADGNVAVIRPNVDSTDFNANLLNFQYADTGSITEKDVEDIGKIENLQIAPISVLYTQFSTKDEKSDSRKMLVGSNKNLLSVAKLEMSDGDFIGDKTLTQAVVLGHQLAIDLFGTENAVGSLLTTRDKTMTVIGVLKSVNQPINYHGIDFDNVAITPLSMAKTFTQNTAQIQQALLASDKKQDIDQLVAKSREILAKNHNNQPDNIILTSQELKSHNGKLFSGIIVTVMAIAGIALAVGGISIMNIMLVNVAERSHEISVKKAIGATKNDIVEQFLIESLIIGLVGGVLGCLIGVGVSFTASFYLPFLPLIDWRILLISLACSIVLGIIFGVYPSIRASQKDPIEGMHR